MTKFDFRANPGTSDGSADDAAVTSGASIDKIQSKLPTLGGADISVVMITMNEERAVAKVIGDIQASLPGAEIVIVDFEPRTRPRTSLPPLGPR